MKIKELKRTVNVCWSPTEHYPATIAAGSAAQQVDDSFSSSSYLELYSLNLEDPGLDLELKSSLQTQHKFQKLVWSGAGIIVGGCDGGLLQFYNAERLLKNASDALMGSSTKHNGHVSALDINPYQRNLLASGASESEIFIWDLNNTSQPMAPGTRNQPYDHVQGLAWNQQVQHILGSTFASRCVVWDLRKNEPIMKLSDSQSRTRWRSLAWHPAVATQLCIASEDDQVPVVQLWDLRLAASPLATLEGHNKGVMSVSWSKHDPDLLLSAGKDGRVLCWNPNNTKPGGELLAEISQQQQWVFEVGWCPRDPALLATASFDQQVAVHSLLGGSRPETNAHNQSNIMDSFGGLDSFSQLPAVSRAPQTAHVQPQQLPAPPRWLKRPVSAKFSFGGKLVTFEKCPQELGTQKLVYVSQVVSEPEIVERATELDSVLGSSLSQDPGALERLAEYCRQRGDAAVDQNERFTWFFLRANFLPTFRSEVLNLLGFKQNDIPSKFKTSNALQGDGTQHDLSGLSRGESTETEAELSTDTSTDLSDAHTLIERKLANLDLKSNVTNVLIPNGEDSTSLICRALVCGNLEEAVELCLDAKRIADALIIASLGSQELLYKVQKYHLNHTSQDPVSLISGSLLQSKWDLLVQGSSASSWRDTLAALVTHTEGEALSHYCEMLGDKLAKESDPTLSEAASICYLCAMCPEPLVARSPHAKRRDVSSLSRLTELALLARRAAAARGRLVQAGGKVESVLNEYASRLASQGCLQSALNTLEGIQETVLRDRLMHALGLAQPQRKPSHQPQQFSSNRARTMSTQSQRGAIAHHNEPPNAYGTVPHSQPLARNTWGVPAQAPAPPSAAPQPPPIQTQPMAAMPTIPTMPAQPPRPESSGPQGGLASRSKYKVDPSVQSAPLYNQYSFNNPSQPAYGFNSPLPDQYNNSSVPNTFTPINNPASMNPLNPINPLNSINPLNPMNPVNPINPANTVMNGAYYGQQATEAAPAPMPKSVTPGWNDPPMMSSKPKPVEASEVMSASHAGTRRWRVAIEHRRHAHEHKQEAVQNQAPITHPLFGVEPPQHVPLVPQQYPGPPYPGQQYPGQYPDQQYQAQYPPGIAPAYPQQAESPAPVEVVPVQKAPIPDEHVILQSVFDNLRNECSNRAANPQMKRKLDDVQRKLENLYDLLREYRLSENALATLHSCAACAQACEYESALRVTTALATGADFAAVAAFLPGLKTLLQLAAR